MSEECVLDCVHVSGYSWLTFDWLEGIASYSTRAHFKSTNGGQWSIACGVRKGRKGCGRDREDACDCERVCGREGGREREREREGARGVGPGDGGPDSIHSFESENFGRMPSRDGRELATNPGGFFLEGRDAAFVAAWSACEACVVVHQTMTQTHTHTQPERYIH
jgi:hypothetical protein